MGGGANAELALATLPGEPEPALESAGGHAPAAGAAQSQDAARPGSKRRKKKRKDAAGSGEQAVPGQPLPDDRGASSAGSDKALALRDAGEGDGDGEGAGDRDSLELVPLGDDDHGGENRGDANGAIVPLDAESGGRELGWRERAKQKKLELAQRKQALKDRASEMKLKAQAMKEGDLGSAGGCFTSEAAFDSWIDTAMIGLLVLVCVCSLAAQVTPWAHGRSAYIAPFDSAEAQLEVTLWLWHGEFHLEQQATDPPPPPPIHCWTNEHVLDGQCVACAVGKIRPAGDDRTQGDTHCVNERGLVISVLNLGASAETDADPAAISVNQTGNGTSADAAGTPMVRPAPPPPTASGPLLEVVSATDITYGGTVNLAPGMHQGIARVFHLDGGYQLPPAPGALWTARLLLLVSAVVSCTGILTLWKLLRFHRAAAKRAIARRRKAMPDPPVELINRSRGQIVLCAAFSAIGFVMGHNATVPTVGATVVRCCSMFAAACGSQTTVDYGAALALLGAISAALT
jgi:hypothetical protein